MTPERSAARRRTAPAPRYRDAEPWDDGTTHDAREGKRYVAAIGIDQYRSWPGLMNAVSDACGALRTFEKLGFEPIREPILDGAATGDALRRLVTDDLTKLGEDDSLVLFFAGHGHTVITPISDGGRVKLGYLIPADADRAGGRASTWLPLDSWLNDVDRLSARHVLVILDACHSGIALTPVIRARGEILRIPEPLQQLRERRSRRVFTSALDGQLALDSGPIRGHSLFTGCLIEALAGGFFDRTGARIARASSIWNHVCQQVIDYPGSRQTPDVGALGLHNHGDLILDLLRPVPASAPRAGLDAPVFPARPLLGAGRATSSPSAAGIRSAEAPGGARLRSASPSRRSDARRASTKPPPSLERGTSSHDPGSVSRVDEPLLDAAFVATLDRQEEARRRGGAVLSVIAGGADGAMDWAAWAAGRGHLTLVTEGAGLDDSIEDLLAQTPWLRCLPMARRSLAAAAQVHVDAIDAELDGRSDRERREWIGEISGLDPQVLVSGWLLSSLRDPAAGPPNVAAAPLQGGALLSALCELATPIAVLVHRLDPTPAWLERAIRVTAGLVPYLSGRPIAVAAPAELVTRVLGGGRSSAALSMARQGLVQAAAHPRRAPDGARGRVAQVLHAALERDSRTALQFAPNVHVPLHDGGPAVDVDLVAEAARLAVVIDGWYRGAGPQAYRRDRDEDARLQRAGYFVMRFAAEDIGARLALVVHEIALGLGGRRASGSFRGGPSW